VLKTAPKGAVITMFAENIAAAIAKLDEFEKTV